MGFEKCIHPCQTILMKIQRFPLYNFLCAPFTGPQLPTGNPSDFYHVILIFSVLEPHGRGIRHTCSSVSDFFNSAKCYFEIHPCGCVCW